MIHVLDYFRSSLDSLLIFIFSLSEYLRTYQADAGSMIILSFAFCFLNTCPNSLNRVDTFSYQQRALRQAALNVWVIVSPVEKIMNCRVE